MSSKPWLDYSVDERFKFLLENSEDCKFRVEMDGREEPREFKSFKFILCSISPVFDRMFNGDFKEANDSEPVAITDIFACDFEAFLDFVYFRMINIARPKKLYDIVKKYMAEQCVDVVINELMGKIKTPVEALQYYEIMHGENREVHIHKTQHSKSFGTPVVETEVPTYVGQLLRDAINNSSSYIANMSPEMIKMLLSEFRRFSWLKPEKIFETIAHLEGKLSSWEIKSIVNEYDFSELSISAYFEEVEPSNFIDKQMKNDILRSICRLNLGKQN